MSMNCNAHDDPTVVVFGDTKKWVTSLQPGVLFTLDEAREACRNESRASVQKSLSRLCQGEDPVLARAARGWYTRREQGPEHSLALDGKVSLALAWRIAGPGSGLADLSIINHLGWSTQVPWQMHIAVVGRPPKPPRDTVNYLQRSNQERLCLSRLETQIIEAVRAFDVYSIITWDEAMEKVYHRRMLMPKRGKVDPNKVNHVASLERRKTNNFLRRCEDLAGLYAW